ncbi:hypothetical protein P170DRAFT_512769 [Aspergillus steynii IBT 23096]|uniref:F-box domain-containing protein n=1 Tax=Aspergillus steynii IBT 23096 TaxID=1392250 RepID=A0A2I2G031_9EURO|nr:uncharacterized protein P170DRAFT_512769 [Aspergillus steynii IBT 23096]PLB46224.1 hypothetical protein P170DRAFT_512769 [Aspergillus steynii IBT 23096]
MSSEGINKLPVELVMACAKCMDIFTLIRLSATCKGMYHILREEKRKLIKEYAYLPPKNPEAVYGSRTNSLRAFLAAGADPNGFNENTRLLSIAARYGNIDTVVLLMEFGAEFYLYDNRIPGYEWQYTPLLHALWAKVDRRVPCGNHGSTRETCSCENRLFALMRAGLKVTTYREFRLILSFDDHLKVLKYAVEHGSNFAILKPRLSYYSTALHIMVEAFMRYASSFYREENIKTIKWFALQYPNMLFVRDERNRTLLDVCLRRRRMPNLIRFLVKHDVQTGWAMYEEVGAACILCPEVVPLINKTTYLASRQAEGIDRLLPHDLIPWD